MTTKEGQRGAQSDERSGVVSAADAKAQSRDNTQRHSMKPLPHLYEVNLFSTPKGYATLLMDGVPALRSAPPKDFGGPEDAWSPEHLLLASVETCFVFTFRAVAEVVTAFIFL